MNCSLCNAETTRKIEDFFCESKIIGDVLVPSVEVEKCLGCGALKLSAEAENEVSHYLKMMETNAIISLPADNLISAGQAAGILGVTKQAFSKNPKIKKGFVYFTYVCFSNKDILCYTSLYGSVYQFAAMEGKVFLNAKL